MKQEEYFGFGSIKNLKNILEKENVENVFLVTGKSSYETCGAKREIEDIFKKLNVDFKRFCEFSPNPKIEEIKKGYALFEDRDYDVIIGVGGGSVIDTAKTVKLFDFEETGNKTPLIAIPTTAGSGSEATYFIAYYIGKRKISAGKKEITLPNYVICDSELTESLPKEIAASSGMDALSQAVESYWSIYSTEESKKFSKESIRLSLGNLERAVNTNDKKAKENMMMAANLAGKAINIAKTTACHSIAYPMTYYFGIAHGHATALTLGEMLRYNSRVTEKDCNDSRGEDYVKETISEVANLFGKNIYDACYRIENIMVSIGLETRLSKLWIGYEERELIIKNGFKPERVKNNPRVLTKEGLRKILENIL